MSSLTTAQHHRMCVFHLAIEEVPLPVAQVESQTPPYPTAECSNIQPVTRLWPGYMNLESLPNSGTSAKGPAFFYLSVTVAYVMIKA